MNNPSGRIKPIQIGFGFLLRARIVHQTRLLRLTHRRSGSPADAPGLIQKQTNGGHKNQKGPVLDQIPHHSANELVLESVAEFLALPANSDAHPAELVGFFIGDWDWHAVVVEHWNFGWVGFSWDQTDWSVLALLSSLKCSSVLTNDDIFFLKGTHGCYFYLLKMINGVELITSFVTYIKFCINWYFYGWIFFSWNFLDDLPNCFFSIITSWYVLLEHFF